MKKFLINFLVLYLKIHSFILLNFYFYCTLFGFYDQNFKTDITVKINKLDMPNASYFLKKAKYRSDYFNTWIYFYSFLYYIHVVEINDQIFKENLLNGEEIPFNNIRLALD